MSGMFGGPKSAKPEKVVEKDITSPKNRGAAGRTILAGATTGTTGTTDDVYKKKSILGG